MKYSFEAFEYVIPQSLNNFPMTSLSQITGKIVNKSPISSQFTLNEFKKIFVPTFVTKLTE